MCNDLLYTEFDTGKLDGFKGAVNHWMLRWVVLSSVFRVAGASGVTKVIYKQFCFFPLGPMLLLLVLLIIIIINHIIIITAVTQNGSIRVPVYKCNSCQRCSKFCSFQNTQCFRNDNIGVSVHVNIYY